MGKKLTTTDYVDKIQKTENFTTTNYVDITEYVYLFSLSFYFVSYSLVVFVTLTKVKTMLDC